MRKVIGKGVPFWNELSDILLDVEIQVNRRPLSYVEEDVELSVLTPASFLFQRTTQLPEMQPCHEEEGGLRKRLKFLKNIIEGSALESVEARIPQRSPRTAHYA